MGQLDLWALLLLYLERIKNQNMVKDSGFTLFFFTFTLTVLQMHRNEQTEAKEHGFYPQGKMTGSVWHLLIEDWMRGTWAVLIVGWM